MRKKNNTPSFYYENQLSGQCVVGIDEVGCGPWAGPVIAAAAFLSNPPFSFLENIQDSKKLSPLKRRKIFDICLEAPYVFFAVGSASVEEIDTLNILRASHLAMERALASFPIPPSHILVDGLHKPNFPYFTTALPKGDQLSYSIATASVLAKVTRDNRMKELHEHYPYYAWDRNAGYGTLLHREGIKTHGVTIHHRKSFKPIQRVLQACSF